MSTPAPQPAPGPHARETRDVERYLRALFGREPQRGADRGALPPRRRDAARLLCVHRHARRRAAHPAPRAAQRRLRRRRATTHAAPAARTPSTASGRCGPTSTTPTHTTRLDAAAGGAGDPHRIGQRGAPARLLAAAASRSASAPVKRPTAASPRAGRRQRRRDERRDDLAPAGHNELQASPWVPGRGATAAAVAARQCQRAAGHVARARGASAGAGCSARGRGA